MVSKQNPTPVRGKRRRQVLPPVVSVFRQLYRRPTAAFGTTVVLVFLLLAIVGPFVTPYTATEQMLQSARQAPSVAHVFGTDNLGRDVFSRVIIGTRSILLLAGFGTLLAVLSGTLLGLLSGYVGGWFDELLMRSFDSLLAMPALLLALLLLGAFGPSRETVLVVIVLVYTPIVARVVRSEVLALKTRGFVEAARLQGESAAHILLREILPSVWPALAVEASLRFSYAIFLVASLGFLGVGVQPPEPDWGLMVNEARNFVRLTPWALFFPALAISTLVVGVNLMADGLKQVLQASAAGDRVRQAYPQSMSSETRSSTLLQVENLTVAYRQKGRWLPALRDVTLHIAAGQSYGLVGESGSGKSTLAAAMMRHLSENGAVRAGQIHFDGQSLLVQKRADMEQIWGRLLALVPQNPQLALNPSLTVGEQLAEGLRRHLKLSAVAATERSFELLREVNLPDAEQLARRYPHQLSGGQLQRVLIAMAVSTNPKLLVLDEPTTSLDVTTEAAMLDLFETLLTEHAAATLYVSHNLGVVARISDRVAVLYAGELVEDAATAALYEQPLHPYTQGLLDSIPRLGLNKYEHTLPAMGGSIPSLTAIPEGCVFSARCPVSIDRCVDERPALETVGKERRVRCHRWSEIASGSLNVQSAFAQALAEDAARTSVAAPPSSELVLQIEDLRQTFVSRRTLFEWLRRQPGALVRAVDGVSLHIAAGQTLGLVGESGSGKTTLARTLMGLVPLHSGRMVLADQELPDRLGRRDLTTLKQLQLVFQNPAESLNPYRSVRQTLLRPLQRLRGLSRREAELYLDELLLMVRLPRDYADRLPGQLSGGEKQRVALARAFAAEPRLLVCDEPLSALDVSVQAAVLNLLNNLQLTRQQTYLFISHDLAVVSYLADQIVVLYLGQVMEAGATMQVLQPPYHPYTEALLAAVPQPDPQAHPRTLRLGGEIPSPSRVPSGCRFHTRCPRRRLLPERGEICATTPPPRHDLVAGHHFYCHFTPSELEAIQTTPTQQTDHDNEGAADVTLP